MASAPDIITYVGVPLTVLGIMPILWNFFKAFWIRFRLSKSIPWQLRPFYTISADAANGEVTVVVDSISCVHPGLWPDPDKRSGVQCTLSPGMLFKRWSHRVFFRYLHACEPVWTKLCSAWSNIILRWLPNVQEAYRFSDIDAENYVGSLGEENKKMPAVWSWTGEGLSLEPKPFCLDEPDLLFRPWMAVATKLGVCIHKELQNSHGLFLKRPALRFTVGMDMEIPKHPALAMNATDFVWFALALGVNPLEFDPQKPGFVHGRRCGHNDAPIVRFFNIEDDWCFELVRGGTKQQFSIQLALAWINVMCSERDGSIFCRRLLEPMAEEAPLSRSFFDEGNFSPNKFRLDRLGRNDNTRRLIRVSERVYGYSLNDRRVLAATIWWGYVVSWRKSQSSKEVAFPISQFMLETRERSLCFLRRFDLDGFLLKLLKIFRERAFIVNLPGVASSESVQETPASEPTYFSFSCFELRLGDDTALITKQGVEPLDEACADFLKNSAAEHRENVLKGKSPPDTPKQMAMFQPHSTTKRVIEELRDRAAKSQYVSESYRVGALLRDMRDTIGKCRDQAASETDARQAAIEIFTQLETTLKTLLPQSDELSFRFPGAHRGSAFVDLSMETIYQVVNFPDLMKSLENEHDSVDVSKGAPGDGSKVGPGVSEDDDSTKPEERVSDESTTILAHILLGYLAWDNTQRTPWKLDEAVSSDLQEIHKKLQNPNFDPDDLCQFLDQAAERAEKGIYTASEEPVCELFEKFREKGTVYLI